MIEVFLGLTRATRRAGRRKRRSADLRGSRVGETSGLGGAQADPGRAIALMQTHCAIANRHEERAVCLRALHGPAGTPRRRSLGESSAR